MDVLKHNGIQREITYSESGVIDVTLRRVVSIVRIVNEDLLLGAAIGSQTLKIDEGQIPVDGMTTKRPRILNVILRPVWHTCDQWRFVVSRVA